MKKTILFAALLLLTTAGYAQSEQSNVLPRQAISTAAAHLPSLVRYDGTGEKVTAAAGNYEAESFQKLQNWANQYPEEVTNYLNVVSVYLHDTKESSIPATEKSAYDDLKAQWIFINEIIKNKS
jgi:hypothetical protein